ncbi:MAG: hypothetical protein R3C51_12475 [Parvularculaceae bacterium]
MARNTSMGQANTFENVCGGWQIQHHVANRHAAAARRLIDR